MILYYFFHLKLLTEGVRWTPSTFFIIEKLILCINIPGWLIAILRRGACRWKESLFAGIYSSCVIHKCIIHRIVRNLTVFVPTLYQDFGETINDSRRTNMEAQVDDWEIEISIRPPKIWWEDSTKWNIKSLRVRIKS